MTVLPELIGNTSRRNALLASARAERLHHACLLLGPSGIGKKTLALLLACALNCLDGAPGQRPCGDCSACRRILDDQHPDVWRVEPGGKSRIINIAQVRDLQRQLTLKRVEGRFRVVILQDADRLRAAAANCLLKSLEEPPEGTIFLLTAPRAAALLPTILSRCQRVRLAPLPPEELAGFLQEQHGIAANEAMTRARAARGSVGAALTLDVETLESRRKALEGFLAAATAGGCQALDYAEGFGRDREALAALLEQLQDLLRAVAIRRVAEKGASSGSHALHGLVDTLLPGDELMQAHSMLLSLQGDLIRNPNVRLLLERLCLDWSRRAAHG